MLENAKKKGFFFFTWNKKRKKQIKRQLDLINFNSFLILVLLSFLNRRFYFQLYDS